MAWLVMQVADVILNNVVAPGWVFHVLLLFLAVGFTFAVFFAWAFELTPDGLKREHEVDRTHSITPQTGKKLNNLIFAVMALAIAYFLYDKFVVSAGRETAAIESAVENATYQVFADQAAATAVNAEPDKSIAVLPFVNMSDDKDYFADGLSEELLNLLVKIPGLKVAGRTSSFAFKGRNEDLREIGRTLDVTTVLEGSVRKSGMKLRITAQLINVADGYHIWSNTYNREMTDIFEMQDDIATNIMTALEMHLSDGVKAPTRGLPTTSMEAYQLYLEARAIARVDVNAHQGEDLYRRAIALDPNFVEAHVGLAEVFADQAGIVRDFNEAMATAREHAAIAMTLDPDHLWARVLWQTSQPVWQFEEEIELLRGAVADDPNNSYAIDWLLYDLNYLGYGEEALRYADAALKRDPLALSLENQRGFALRILDRNIEAEAAFVKYATINDTLWRLRSLAFTAYLEGRETDAEAYLKQVAEKSEDTFENLTRYYQRVLDPKTRDEEFANPSIKKANQGLDNSGAASFYYRVRDDRFWDLFAALTTSENESNFALGMIQDHDPAILNDPRYRTWADERGISAYWKKHGVPDFCDGSFESWICELGDRRPAP